MRPLDNWYDQWSVFYAGMCLILISLLVLRNLINKVNKNEYITSDEMRLLIPARIAGVFGPVISVLGLIAATDVEGSSFPFWGIPLVIGFIGCGAVFLIYSDIVSDYREKTWRLFE